MARKTVLLGGFAHESSTFSPLETRREDFWIADEEQEIQELLQRANEYSGAFKTLSVAGYDVRVVIGAGAPVGGVIQRAVYDAYLSGLKHALALAPLDDVAGIQWVLHGSSTVAGLDDVQAHLIRTLRCLVPHVPLVVSLDLHSTITPEMLSLVDGLVQYRTAPHRDVVETGQHGSQMLDRLIVGTRGASRAMVKIPMLLPGEFGQTDQSPLVDFLQQCQEIQHRWDAVDMSVSQGFPWADNRHGVVTIVATVEGQEFPTDLLNEMRHLARQIWQARRAIHDSVRVVGVKEALATLVGEGPLTVLCDSGDNPTAGAPEDRVDVLEEALRRGVQGLTFIPVVDAPFTSRCHAAGDGRTVSGPLGGTLGGTPEVAISGTVLRRGQAKDTGKWAVVGIDGNQIVVTEKRFGVSTPQYLNQFGWRAGEPVGTLVVKSGYLFPQWGSLLRSVGGREVLLNTQGASTLDLRSLPYCEMPPDVFPLAEHAANAMLKQYVTVENDRIIHADFSVAP